MGLLLLCVIHAARSGNIFPWVYIIIFLPGLGAIAYILAVILPEALKSRTAGQLASSHPLVPSVLATSTTVMRPGGQPASVQFSGLAPGEIGVYQINVTVPANIPPGTQQVVVSIGGQTSPASALPIQ